MQFVLNGESTEMSAGSTIQDVVNTMEVGTKRYAVECNEEIVPRSLHTKTAVQQGDQIEIVVSIGGG